jgi:hypothetical protein
MPGGQNLMERSTNGYLQHAMIAMLCLLLAACGSLDLSPLGPGVTPDVIGMHDEPLEGQGDPNNWKATIRFGTPEDDSVTSLAVAPDGGVLVAGFTSGQLSGVRNGGGRDGFVVKFDRNGIKRWTRTIRTQSDDVISKVTVDARSNVYVAGTTDGLVADELGGSTDAFVVKFDAAGRWRWSRQFGSVGVERVTDLRLTGEIVSIAGVWDVPNGRGFVVELRTNGSALNDTVFNPPRVPDAFEGTRIGWFDEFVLGAHGQAFGLSRQVAFKTSGAFSLVRYNADGSVQGVTSERGVLPILSSDARGKLFYLRPYSTVQGIDESGNPTWTVLERERVVSSATTDDDHVYAAGGCYELPLPIIAPDACFRSFVTRHDANGKELERFELDVMPGRQAELFTALAVNGPNVFAAGYVSDGSNRDVMLARFVSSQ